MQQSLAGLLLPEYRRRVLALLLLRPDEALHGREIARRTGLPAGTVNRELQRLADAGLLRRERRGNQQIYSAEDGCPIYAELASILKKTSGLADVIARALAPAASRIRCAFVFGSVAAGRETSRSDVDLMLIGDIGFAQALELLHFVQDEIGREVNPKVFLPTEWAARAEADPFVRNVLSRPKIFVIGNESELAELGRRQP